MDWYRIEIGLPFLLLESTYNFLWLFINGLSVEKRDKDFLLKAYLFSADPDDLIKRLNNFLRIRSKISQARHTPPSAHRITPSQVGEFIVVPTPTAYVPPFGIPIFIQRGRAFGIGSHPCTVYCLQAVRDIYEMEPDIILSGRILDAGAGTGILSIAAAKLGAKDITGVEISLEALKEAQENIGLNGKTGEIRLLHSSVTDIKERFGLILANLYGPLLIEIVSSLVELLAPRGWLILGGMAVPHDDVVVSTFVQYSLTELIRYRDEDWAVAVLRRVS
jgi:ribosomal protein L11 methylase PrmA